MTMQSRENQPLLPFDFHQAQMPPAFLQVKKLAQQGYSLFGVMREINRGNVDILARFGDRPPVLLRDLIFDLTDPQRCYALCQKIWAEGKETPSSRIAEFDMPIFIITSQPAAGERYNYNDATAEGNVFFRACDAIGERGRRVITPVLEKACLRSFDRFKKEGAKIAALYSVRLEQDNMPDSFTLKFETGIGEMQNCFIKSYPSTDKKYRP